MATFTEAYEKNRNEVKSHATYMKKMMEEKKTTDSFTRNNMIVDYWNEDKGFYTKETRPEFNQCREVIDRISAQYIKEMPWTAFFDSGKKVTAKKEAFFNKVKKYIDENCMNADVAAFMFYYAASSNASVYSGVGCTTKGRTYDRFVEEGNKHVASFSSTEMHTFPKTS